jgi:hypothetical protein
LLTPKNPETGPRDERASTVREFQLSNHFVCFPLTTGAQFLKANLYPHRTWKLLNYTGYLERDMRSHQQQISTGRTDRSETCRWTLAKERMKGFILPRQNEDLSLNQISKGTGIKRRTVINAINSLERAGYLCVERRRLLADFNAPNRYKWVGDGSESNARRGSEKLAPKEVSIMSSLVRGAAAPHPASETPLRNKNQNREGVVFSGGAGAAAPEKEFVESVRDVGSKNTNGEGARGRALRSRGPKPPDSEEMRVIDHFQLNMGKRMGRPAHIVTNADLRAYRKFRWQYQSDPSVTTDVILDCITNACASSAFPFYRNSFSLAEFCRQSPLQKFGSPSATLDNKPNGFGSEKGFAMKPVKYVVADSDRSFLKEFYRFENEMPKEYRKHFVSIVDDTKAFYAYTGWRVGDVDLAELDMTFLETLSDVYQQFVVCAVGEPPLPGILMCKVADACLDQRNPVPPNFFEYKTELRKRECETDRVRSTDEDATSEAPGGSPINLDDL